MKVTDIKSCYIGPEISPEQFIAEHIFLYLAKGKVNGYDGNKKQAINAGEHCLFFKNHLARYTKEKSENEFEKVVIIFDEAFLKKFQEKHKPTVVKFKSESAFLKLEQKRIHIKLYSVACTLLQSFRKN